MKKLLTNSITTAVGMPFKSGALEHLQAAYTEAIGEIGKSLAGSGYAANTVYILSGLVNSGTGSTYNISAGSVFYNGEVYLVPAASFTTTGLQFPVGVISTTFFSAINADPVGFTNGTPHNVHQINTIVLQAGGSTTGIGIYTDYINLDKRLKGAIGQIVMFNYKFYGNSLSTFFNTTAGPTYGMGIHPYTIGWAIANGNNGTDDMGGRFAVGYSNTDTDYDTPYTDVGGAKTVTLISSNLPAAAAISYKVSLFVTASNNQGGASNYLNQFAPAPLTGSRVGMTSLEGGQSQANNRMAYYNDTATLNGSNVAFDKRPPYKTVLYVQRIA